MGRLPDFLIIGAAKSGTTSLNYYLSLHPEIYCAPQCVNYFDRNFDKGLSWYTEQFSGAANERVVGEASPEYMYNSEVPPRMSEALPDTRLVAILRNPIDRAYSHYWHNRTRGHEPLSFLDALAAEPARLEHQNELGKYRYSYLDRGFYLRQLERVCQHYPPEGLCVVLSEELRVERAAVLQSVFRFLGVDDTVQPEGMDVTKNAFMTFRAMSLRKPIRRLPGPLRRFATKLNARRAAYPPLPAETRQELQSVYAGPNQELASWLGRDLAKWWK